MVETDGYLFQGLLLGVRVPNEKGPPRGQSTKRDQDAKRNLFCFPAFSYGEYSENVMISTKWRTLLKWVVRVSAIYQIPMGWKTYQVNLS